MDADGLPQSESAAAEAATPGGECPAVRAAAEALARAKAELKKAQDFYEEVCRQAGETVQAMRETTLGEVVHCTLESVKKNPGRGLLAAGLIGFLLGRMFKR